MSQQSMKATWVIPSGLDALSDAVSDTFGRMRTLWTDTSRLCSVCRNIPFTDGLRSDGKTSNLLYLTDLTHILEERNCPVCGLLLRCLKEPENDLFEAAHVKDHLKSSPKLKDFRTSNDWLQWYTSHAIKGGEEAWPFGNTRDPEGVQQTMEEVKRLFPSAENQDIHAGGAESAMTSKRNALNDTLHAASFGMNAASVANPKIGDGRQFAMAKMFASEAAIWTKHAKTKLPCYIAIRLYGQDEDKFGAISVRVYACGRAPRAAAREVCHFTLRARESTTLRVKDGQLWYGRVLQPEIDFTFFRHCLKTCREQPSHQASCGKKPPAARIQAKKRWTFRLVDVEDDNVIDTDFEAFAKPNSPFAYVAVSYVWGHVAIDHDELVFSATSKRSLRQKGSLAQAKLAATIRDAMFVVKKMGQRYLWVDRLCVMQRSGSTLTASEQEELSHAIRNMGRIYSHALFTIVDGNSEGSKNGLLRTGSGRDTSGQIIQQITGDISVFLPTSMSSDLSRWESRAWTFQEKVLSRRMLVFSNGFAQWQCQEGIWREDVNARDVNAVASAISHSYLTTTSSPSVSVSDEERYGLQKDEKDGGTRLCRTSAFSQYAQCVHDYSMRTIRNPGEILHACKGILKVLGSKELLDTEFLHGLPRMFIDSALLWHTQFAIRRRHGYDAPPSWSWAGWELRSDSRNSRQTPVISGGARESEGPCAFYRTPFHVHFDDDGMRMHLVSDGEERMRPLASIFGFPAEDVPLPQLGLLGMPWMESLASPHADMPSAYSDWEFHRIRDMPHLDFLEMIDQGSGQRPLCDKHLIICTEQATLYLGSECPGVRRYTTSIEAAYPDFKADIELNGDVRARERWLFLGPTAGHNIGIAAHYTMPVGKSDTVKAILLSEAQFQGDELRPDVLGYPLYNVMLIEDVEDGVVERVGLGRVRKSAWRQASPRSRTVILG